MTWTREERVVLAVLLALIFAVTGLIMLQRYRAGRLEGAVSLASQFPAPEETVRGPVGDSAPGSTSGSSPGGAGVGNNVGDNAGYGDGESSEFTSAGGSTPDSPDNGASDDARPPLWVHVAGAVTDPGVYELKEGQRVVDAVTAAGGARDDARTDLINLAARLSDGQQVYVPSSKETGLVGGGAGTWSGSSWAGGSTATAGPVNVNLNRAGKAELDTLPGIGPALAQRIIDYRQTHGPFRQIEDIQRVSGIGPAKFEEIKRYLTVG